MSTRAASNPGARVALLFGSEKTGLSNDELSHCHSLLTIPMNEHGETRHLSMNLGQAAAVCLYELTRESAVRAETPGVVPASSVGDLERMTQLLGEVLEHSGYTRRHPANARENNVRRLVLRMGWSPGDATVWTGVLRQILHGLHARGHDDKNQM